MSDLKVGDVCIVVAPATADVVGMECVIFGAEQEHRKKASETELVEIWWCCFGFHVRLADGRHMAIERACLRKKPPKSDDQGEPRTDFTPADQDFREDLQRRLTTTVTP
jgi:hypothetical protein